jgi:hypothetical protein
LSATTDDMADDGGVETGTRPQYEKPMLIPVGSLHDILAGAGTQMGDAQCTSPNQFNPTC